MRRLLSIDRFRLRIAPAVGIQPARIVRTVSQRLVVVDFVSIDVVAIDVVPVEVVAVGPVASNVLLANRGIAIQGRAVVIDVTVGDVSIDIDVSVAVVDIDVAIDIDERAINANPAATDPTVVINTSSIPVPIVVQPRADGHADSKRDYRSGDDITGGWTAVDVNYFRVVLRNVDHLRLLGNDLDCASLDDDLLL